MFTFWSMQRSRSKDSLKSFKMIHRILWICFIDHPTEFWLTDFCRRGRLIRYVRFTNISYCSYLVSSRQCCCFAPSDTSERRTPTNPTTQRHDYCERATSATVVASPCEGNRLPVKLQLVVRQSVWPHDLHEHFNGC